MRKAKIYYARMDELWRKEEKLRHLEKLGYIGNLDWQEIKPDKSNTWLTEESEMGFEYYLPIGNRIAKTASEANQEVIFKLFSLGVSTNRDSWAYNFNFEILEKNIKKTINVYLEQLCKWGKREHKNQDIDEFIIYDDEKISWSRDLKKDLKSGRQIEFSGDKIRSSIYRPFTHSFLYFSDGLNDSPGQFPYIFPTSKTEEENQLIWLKAGSEIPFFALSINRIPDLLPQGGSQCFPFYTYDKDGSNRRENITDWSLEQFQTHYQDPTITKWDIFHYTYAVLHHPHYRTRYAANLKRELPRIPFAPTFRPFATAGKRLAEIHIHYEQQPEYPLKHQENKDLPIDWRVEKMRLSKDKTQLKYNDFLTLTDIPPEAFEYRLGNRSALHWIIDQYQISTDKRSGITNDPNRLDDEEYIVRLIKQVITVSLETVQIVNNLPDLGLPND
jgi:predicted helicase